MGCNQSVEDKDQKRQNDLIEKDIQKDHNSNKREAKILVLGAGESGKSTIIKQMKLIHDVGYTPEERDTYKEIIFSNTIQSMHIILEWMRTLGIAIGNAENQKYAAIILNFTGLAEVEVFPKEPAEAIKVLWQDSGVKACFDRSSEYQLNDSSFYYFDAIERLSKDDFIPTDQDILRSRVKTTGIVESNFKIGQLTYKMYDVGGQRSERKKWIHCFENVTAILFLAALSEYDQKLVEDETVNRMEEAITLFENICNSRWFVKTSMILFLNKTDLFKTKLKKIPLVKFYPDFKEGDNYEAACRYFSEKFIGLNKTEEKQVYTHFTCATDTTQIKFVMAAVDDIVVQLNLRDAGF